MEQHYCFAYLVGCFESKFRRTCLCQGVIVRGRIPKRVLRKEAEWLDEIILKI